MKYIDVRSKALVIADLKPLKRQSYEKNGVHVVSDKKYFFFHYKVMPVIYLSESQ